MATHEQALTYDLEKKVSSDHVEQEVKRADDIDRHLQVLRPASLQGMTDAELHTMDRKVTRKMDLTLMPILIMLYVLNFLDRNSESARYGRHVSLLTPDMATAKIGEVTKDLNMSNQDFSTAIAVLFAGYSEFLSQESH